MNKTVETSFISTTTPEPEIGSGEIGSGDEVDDFRLASPAAAVISGDLERLLSEDLLINATAAEPVVVRGDQHSSPSAVFERPDVRSPYTSAGVHGDDDGGSGDEDTGRVTISTGGGVGQTGGYPSPAVDEGSGESEIRILSGDYDVDGSGDEGVSGELVGETGSGETNFKLGTIDFGVGESLGVLMEGDTGSGDESEAILATTSFEEGGAEMGTGSGEIEAIGDKPEEVLRSMKLFRKWRDPQDNSTSSSAGYGVHFQFTSLLRPRSFSSGGYIY